MILAIAVRLDERPAKDASPTMEVLYSEMEAARWSGVPWLKSMMLGRVAFELGLHREAIARIEAAAASDSFPSGWRKSAFTALWLAYREVKDSQAQRQFLQAWSFECPDDPEILMKLAAVMADTAEYEKAYNLLAQAARLRPDMEHDTATRVGLALGRLVMEPSAKWADLRAAISTHPQIEKLTDGLLRNYWSSFAELEGTERIEWISAIYAVHILADELKELAPSWRRQAGIAFLTVAEAQIRRKIFGPLRQRAMTIPNLSNISKRITHRDPAEVLARFFEQGRITLGQMRRIIERRDGQGEYSRLTTDYFDASPILLRLDALRRLDRPRNEAVHEFTTLDAESIHADARDVIDAVISHSRLRG